MIETILEIPLTASPQKFAVALDNVEYLFRLTYRDAPETGWVLDLATSAGEDLVCGVPLLPYQNLLDPYDYLELGYELWIDTAGEPEHVPAFEDLGSKTRLYYVKRT